MAKMKVRMLDTVEDTTDELVIENGKKRLQAQTVRLAKGEEYELPKDQADDLISQGVAEDAKKRRKDAPAEAEAEADDTDEAE